MADAKQAVLLTLLPRRSSLPGFPVTSVGAALHYSGGTVPDFHRLPY